MAADQRAVLGWAPPRTDGVPVLFMSSNGVGMGHLTRLLAIALRAEPDVAPVVLSLSRAAGVVEDFGLPWEHLASHTHPGMSGATWADLLRDHVVDTIDRWGVQAVVFDGVAPYVGLRAALDRRPEVHRVWVRRGLWLPGAVADRPRVDWFDLVVEPGELAPVDPGEDDTLQVAPVTLVDRDQLASRDVARRELGLPEEAQVLLVALGSGALTDVATPMRAVLEGLSRDHWVVARPRSPLPGAMVPDDLDVRTFEAYPMARLLPAFDAAIAASGYNAFHELVAARVPTLFLPQPRATDDQARRASQAARAGLGLVATDVDEVADATARLVDPETRAALAERLGAHQVVNGAVAAAAAIRTLVTS
ncbi:UDP-N-acetylglucosamine--LPS N-acetylglucosamine transferase [Salsipaludibacter albus]|uniref:UDP-N-acetylglucosamine--LPS N-acetylglucosamine transferase n=1 Tax=Salsipaludibacter albus TaxID=2849650 RepID=UPI001EE45490|nr:UDP-N-acetylglucosamine--LPS N-acetylglucosamine transferase [Salsipaludibacter albus]MBY5162520.1 UDP-N-acetylglucosamine--LPS N-acetylglucosamine transferase [Salsipaludibacter albus]